MANSTKYDILINFFLDYWIIAILSVLALIIGFIPSLRDGVLQMTKWLRVKKNKEFKIISQDETITFEIKTRSTQFDIVKINCLTHRLGVNAEYLWIKQYYPNFEPSIQILKHIPIDDNQSAYYDVLEIKNAKGKKKTIYFDIAAFLNEHGSTLVNVEAFVESKIREIHNTKEKADRPI